LASTNTPRLNAGLGKGGLRLKTYQYGSPRKRGEGLRLGVARFLPRGVRKTDYASKDFFDVWYPALAPSAELLRWFRRQPDFEKAWIEYAKRYKREMATRPDSRQAVQLVAAMAKRTALAIGCYCADETRCHRSLLAAIIRDAAAASS